MKTNTKRAVLDNLYAIRIELDEDPTFPSDGYDKTVDAMVHSLEGAVSRIVPSVTKVPPKLKKKSAKASGRGKVRVNKAEK